MSQVERGRMLLTMRKDVAARYQPDAREIRLALSILLPPYEEMTIKDVQSAPERFVDLLQHARANVIKPGYYSISFLASHAVAMLACVPTADESMESLRRTDLGVYTFQADLAFGAFSVASIIMSAEDESNKRHEQRTAEAVSEATVTTPIGYGEQADLYLQLRQRAQRHAIIFGEDGTGFRLVDAYIAELKQDKPRECIGCSVPEYFIAGAELGGKLYKAFYELARVLPDNDLTSPSQ